MFPRRHVSDRVSETGSGRGPRKDSLRSMDSFSSFDQLGGQGAVPPITLEPAPETVPAGPPPTESVTDTKPKDSEVATATSTTDGNPDQIEQADGEYLIIIIIF